MNKRNFLKGLMAGSIAGLPKVASVERLEINPTTILVLSIDESIGQETADRLSKAMAEKVPGVKTLVLCGGIKISTLEIGQIKSS